MGRSLSTGKVELKMQKRSSEASFGPEAPCGNIGRGPGEAPSQPRATQLWPHLFLPSASQLGWEGVV